MDLFYYLTFLKNAFLTKKLIYLKIVYVKNESFRCHHTSFQYHTSFLIFGVMKINMKDTYNLAENQQQNQWKTEIKK